MSLVDDAVAEILAHRTLKRGICPVVEQQFLHHRRHRTDEPWDAITAFCTVCPEADMQHWDCPEVSRDAYDERAPVCALYLSGSGNRAARPEGHCKYAHPGPYQCGCFRPRTDEWWAAFNGWVARRRREDAQDERARATKFEAVRSAAYAGHRMMPHAGIAEAFDSQEIG